MRKHRWLGIMCLSLLCLGGCGRETVTADSQASENIGTPGISEEALETLGVSEVTEASETSTTSVAEQAWKTKGFPALEKAGEEAALWAVKYDIWQHEDIHCDSSTEYVYERMAGVCGDQLYRLCQIYPKEGKNGSSGSLLEIYDASTGQTSLTEIDSEKLGADNGFIISMYMAEPGKYVFRILNEQEQINQIVYSDLGDQTQIVDVLPAYQENGIADKIGYECICDAAGNIYTRDSKWQDLYILDRQGTLLMEHRGKDGDNIREPFPMPTGELIFPIYNSEEKISRLVWFDTEQKEPYTLCSFESYPIESVYGIQGSDIYYETREGIVRWNILSGDRTLVYPFDQKCLSRMYRTMLMFRKGLPPVLRMYGTVDNEAEDWLVDLASEEPEPGEAIRVVSLVGTGNTVFDTKSLVAAVSRKYRNVSFVYETFDNAGQVNYQTGIDDSGLEDYRTRILAELSAGGGPDILFVSLQDMRLLQSQGYLMDLRDVLSEDFLNRILPNVLEMGTVKDILAGLAPVLKTDAAITLKEIWDQETWTLEDVMNLMDTGKFTGVCCQGPMGFASQAVMKQLTQVGLEDSSLVDWKTGKSHFDSELFIKMLHISKNYGGDPFGQETWLGEGGCLMQLDGLGIESFNEFYDLYGENYCVVGHPTNEGNGNYLNCGGVLAVNRRVSDQKGVAAFFECLLGEEFQNSCPSEKSILKISTEDIEYTEEGGERKACWKGHELRIKEDGTTTLDDYRAFIEKCVPAPEVIAEDLIKSIVWEEAEAYIKGDKSAEEVAGIIHSRVQLYLDENQ